MHRIVCYVPILLLISLVNAGCNRSDAGLHRFSGKVTHQGRPVQGLLITFTPGDLESKAAAIGATDEEGRFVLKVGSQSGVFPGQNRVTCQDPRALMGGKTSSEADYVACITKYSPKNSTLTIDVTKNESDYELKLD